MLTVIDLVSLGLVARFFFVAQLRDLMRPEASLVAAAGLRPLDTEQEKPQAEPMVAVSRTGAAARGLMGSRPQRTDQPRTEGSPVASPAMASAYTSQEPTWNAFKAPAWSGLSARLRHCGLTARLGDTNLA